MPPNIKPIKIDYSANGANWGVFGIMKVGKSYLTKLIALNYFNNGKRVLILDYNYNDDTYGDFWGIVPYIITLEKFLTINWQMMPNDIVVRVQPNDRMTEFDFNAFFAYSSLITYSVFILDDLGDVFGVKATSAIKNFPATTINNRNEVFYQFHRLNQGFPFLRQKLQFAVLKSIPSDSDIPNDFLSPEKHIRICLREIEEINEKLPFKKKFAWRILNMDDSTITLPNKFKIDGTSEDTVVLPAYEYFKNR